MKENQLPMWQDMANPKPTTNNKTPNEIWVEIERAKDEIKDLVVIDEMQDIELSESSAVDFEGAARELMRKTLESKSQSSKNAIEPFFDWLDKSGNSVIKPDMAGYRDQYFKNGRTLNTVLQRVSIPRTAMRRVIKNPDFRQGLMAVIYSQTPPDKRGSLHLADYYAAFQELIVKIEYEYSADAAQVKTVKVQDITEKHGLWLNCDQANEFLRMPGLESLKGIRNTAIIYLFLATGLRVGELVSLLVEDLEIRMGDEMCLYIQGGKGSDGIERKERAIPYGENIQCLDLVKMWMIKAGIARGYIFRRIDRKRFEDHGLSETSIRENLAQYPIMVDENEKIVKPHDLRRTYARSQYLAGMGPDELRLNMGHENVQTTFRYIGSLDASDRAAKYTIGLDPSKRPTAQESATATRDARICPYCHESMAGMNRNAEVCRKDGCRRKRGRLKKKMREMSEKDG